MAVGMKNADKTRSESRPSTATGASSEKSEERKPHKQQPDNKERVRNKVGLKDTTSLYETSAMMNQYERELKAQVKRYSITS